MGSGRRGGELEKRNQGEKDREERDRAIIHIKAGRGGGGVGKKKPSDTQSG